MNSSIGIVKTNIRNDVTKNSSPVQHHKRETFGQVTEGYYHK